MPAECNYASHEGGYDAQNNICSSFHRIRPACRSGHFSSLGSSQGLRSSDAFDKDCDRALFFRIVPTRSAPLIQERLVARRVHPRTVRRRVSRCVQSVRFGPQACFGRIRAWGTLIGSGRTCESSGRRRHLSSEAFRPLAIVPFMRHCAAKLAMLCLTATGRQGLPTH